MLLSLCNKTNKDGGNSVNTADNKMNARQSILENESYAHNAYGLAKWLNPKLNRITKL